MHILRQVRQKLLNRLECICLTINNQIHHAAGFMNLPSPERLLIQRFTQRPRDHSRASDHTWDWAFTMTRNARQQADPLGNQPRASAAEATGTAPSASAMILKRGSANTGLPRFSGLCHCCRRRFPATLQKSNQRHSKVNCKFFSVDALAKTRGIGRTAFQRKILAPNDYSAPVHLSKSNDVVGRGKRRNLTCLILLGKARAWTVLSEGSCIDQVTNSLPNSQTPFFMVFGNVLATPLLSAQPFRCSISSISLSQSVMPSPLFFESSRDRTSNQPHHYSSLHFRRPSAVTSTPRHLQIRNPAP